MGSEFGVKLRKCMLVPIRRSYRSVCNHPFFIGIFCFLVLLNRVFPFAFSLLVTASPVLVCTAVLLGTLLSFGQTNIPEIEKDDKVSHQISPLKTGFSENTTVVARDGSFSVDRHVADKTDTLENITREGSLVGNKLSDIEHDTDAEDYRHSLVWSSEDVHFDKRVIGEFDKRVMRQEKLQTEGVSSTGDDDEDNHPLINGLGRDSVTEESDNSPADTVCGQRHDQVDSSMLSPWERVGHHNDADADDESIDSESDRAESSSPDASMADIIPILDELHPLLDSEAPQPAPMSHHISDAASEESIDSSSSDGDTDESDEDTENQGEVDGDDEDEDDEKSIREAIKNMEDESKSAIKWTEDDQKNLMDLGTSELERNQRLENLIARRRARKSMAEKNLIDLDAADIPFRIPTISTARRNPFDHPDDSYDSMGLPPIPGSAPSVLQPRGNPFDLPYDSSEEKPDLKGDSFHEEFSAFQEKEAFHQREAVFRRHESFNVGPSTLGFTRPGRQDSTWKPYFVPEQLPTGATSSQFRRQLSEASESKISSVPDTESTDSVIDEEEVKQIELGPSRHIDLTSSVDHASVHYEERRHSSEDIESMDLEHARNGDVNHDVVEITLGNMEDLQQTEPTFSEGREMMMNTEQNTNESHPSTEHIDEDSSTSSLSSTSETEENIPKLKGEASNNFEPYDPQTAGCSISSQASLEESVFHDIQHKEPVYDSSPSSVKQAPSFSSMVSDHQVEMSGVGSPPLLVESARKEPDVQCEGVKVHSSSQELQAGSTEASNEDELGLRDASETSEGDPSNVNSHIASSCVYEIGKELEPVTVYLSVDSMSSEGVPLEEQVEKQPVHQSQNQAASSKLGREGLDHDKDECLNPASAEQRPSICASDPSEAVVEMQRMEKEESWVMQDENQPSGSFDHGSENKPISHEDNVIQKLDRVNTLYHDAGTSIDDHRSDQDFSSPSSNYQDVISPSEGKELPSEAEENVQVTFTTCLVSREAQEVHDPEGKPVTSFSLESTPIAPGSSVLSDDNADWNMKSKILEEIVLEEHEEFIGDKNGAQGFGSTSIQMNTSEGIDDTKQIDEEILSELDAVGDFNVKEATVPEETSFSDSESACPPNDVVVNGVGLSISEARTVDDIGFAFKQLQEGVDFKNVILTSSKKLEEQEPLDDVKTVEDVNIAHEAVSGSGPKEEDELSKVRDKSAEEDCDSLVSTKVNSLDGARMGCEEISEVPANAISDQNGKN